MEREKPTPIFTFDKDELTRHINYEMNLFGRVAKPLTFIFETLEKLGHSLSLDSLDKINLNKVKEREGKNYNWSVIQYKNVKLLIRRYGQHFTIFTRIEKEHEHREGKTKIVTGAFTLYFNFEHLSDNEQDSKMDSLYDMPFNEVNEIAKQMFEVLIKRGTYWLYNSSCLKIPKYAEVKIVYEKEYEEARIYSIDKLVFCMEELDTIHIELFAETVMFEKLKELKVGAKFGRGMIKKVHTELENKYYYGVGVEIEKSNDSGFKDVYCLTRYYYDDVFTEEATEDEV